jgi:hypothetical protein
MTKKYVKVARFMLSPTGSEVTIPLSDGGEAQLWTRSIWENYHEYVQANPQVRGTTHYAFKFIEEMDAPQDDLGKYVLLPEVTNGKEFQIKTNAKN